MNRQTLESHIASKKSLLCVGLDPVIDRLPEGISKDVDGVVAFCKQIIDATLEYCVAYKPNLAFFESLGPKGFEAFAKTRAHIPDTHFVIADAKRGDIGNTAKRYADAFFNHFSCDALTVAPYMGRDSVEPFLVENHWAIVLGLTSNQGSEDFEQQKLVTGEFVWERVISKCVQWGTPENLMLVVGATKPEAFQRIRELAPETFLLVPGIGAQGGDLEGVLKHGSIKGGGLLINSTRGIIYKSSGTDFAEAAAAEAKSLRDQMAAWL